MPDYYDPVTRQWSHRGDPDWHWPWTFLLTAFGIVAAVILLIATVAAL